MNKLNSLKTVALRFEWLFFVSEPMTGYEKHVHPSVSFLPKPENLCDAPERTHSSLSAL